MRQVERHAGPALVPDRQGASLRACLALAEAQLAGRHFDGRENRVVDVEQACALAMGVVNEAGGRVEIPDCPVSAVLQPVADGLRRISALRLRLQEQGHGARHVWGGHGRAADRAVAALVERDGRIDRSARRADVRLQAQVRGHAEGAEARDEAARRLRRAGDHIRPGQRRVAGCDTAVQHGAGSGGDRHDRDRDRRRSGNGRVQDARDVVVQHYRCRTRGLRIRGLDVERAGAASDQDGLADMRRRIQRRAAVVGRRRRSGLGHQQAAAGWRRRRARSGAVAERSSVRGRGEGRLRDMRVVIRGRADHERASARRAGRIGTVRRRAAGAVVADRGNDDHALLDEEARGSRRRVLGPLGTRADAHVEHLHAIRVRALHRRQHDVGGRGTIAAEHAIGAEHDVRGHARHGAVCADDAADVRAVAIAVIRIRVRNRGLVEIEGVADEVPAGDDAGSREHGAVRAIDAVAAEVGVIVVDAGVHHRDLDAGAGVTERVLRDAGAGHLNGGREIGGAAAAGDFIFRQLDPVNLPDLLHARQPGERRALRRVDANRVSIEQRVVGALLRKTHAGRCRRPHELRLLGAHAGKAVAIGNRPALQLYEVQTSVFGISPGHGVLGLRRRETE